MTPKAKVDKAFKMEANRPLSIDELCELTYLSRHHVTTVLRSGGYTTNGKLRNTLYQIAQASPPGVAPQATPRQAAQTNAPWPRKRPRPPYLHMTQLSRAVEEKLIRLSHARLDEMLKGKTAVTRTDTVYTAVQLLAKAYKEGDLAVMATE